MPILRNSGILVFLMGLCWPLLPLKAANLLESCGSRQSAGKSWTYCFYKDPASSSQDVLFYFHGRSESETGNERLWNKENFFPAAIRARWAEQGVAAPMVFAVSFGSTWVLADRDVNRMNVPFALVENEVVALAAQLSGGFRGRVQVLGDSMGGLNAAIFATRTNTPITSLALLCPLIADISPFASLVETAAFLRKNPEANAMSVSMVMGLGRTTYADKTEWENRYPLEVARKRNERYPFSFYASAGTKDQFGIFGGAAAYVSELRRMGTPVEFVSMDANHCAIEPNSLADFLAR